MVILCGPSWFLDSQLEVLSPFFPLLLYLWFVSRWVSRFSKLTIFGSLLLLYFSFLSYPWNIPSSIQLSSSNVYQHSIIIFKAKFFTHMNKKITWQYQNLQFKFINENKHSQPNEMNNAQVPFNPKSHSNPL